MSLRQILSENQNKIKRTTKIKQNGLFHKKCSSKWYLLIIVQVLFS